MTDDHPLERRMWHYRSRPTGGGEWEESGAAFESRARAAWDAAQQNRSGFNGREYQFYSVSVFYVAETPPRPTPGQ